MKYTTAHSRYHIVSKDVGLIETAQSKEEAFRIARRCVSGPEDDVTIFDSMARKGAPEVWRWSGEILRRRVD